MELSEVAAELRAKREKSEKQILSGTDKVGTLIALRTDNMQTIGFKRYDSGRDKTVYALERHIIYHSTAVLIPREKRISYYAIGHSNEDVFGKEIKQLLTDKTDNHKRESDIIWHSPRITGKLSNCDWEVNLERHFDMDKIKIRYEIRKKALPAIGFKKYVDYTDNNITLYALSRHARPYQVNLAGLVLKEDFTLCAKYGDKRPNCFLIPHNAQIDYNLMTYGNEVIFGEKVRQLLNNIV